MSRGHPWSPWKSLLDLAEGGLADGDGLPLAPLLARIEDTAIRRILETAAENGRATTVGELLRSPAAARVIGSLAHPIQARFAAALMLAARMTPRAAPSAEPEGPPEDREGARAWARERGMSPWLEVSVGVLAGIVGRRLGGFYALQTMTVDDALSPPRLPKLAQPDTWEKSAADLRKTVCASLADLGTVVDRGRAAHDAFLARAVEPEGPAVRALVARLSTALDRHRDDVTSGAVLPALGHPSDQVTFDETKRVFTVKPAQKHILRGLPSIEVGLEDPVSITFLGGMLGPTVASAVRALALSATIDALRDPESEAGRRAATFVATPPWQRAVNALERRLSPTAAVARDRVAFRLEPLGGTVRVEPLLQTARGDGFTPGRVVDVQVLRAHASMDRLEERIVADLVALGRVAQGPDHARAYFAMLTALADHPRVYFGPGTRPAVIRRGRLSLALAPEGAAFAPSFLLAGSPRTAAQICALERHGFFVEIDEDEATITLAKLDVASRALVSVLAEHPTTFPAEGVDALFAALHGRDLDLDVELPDELVGETVDADPRPVVRLTPLPGDALVMSLGVRPLPGGAVLEPGAGSERVLGAKEGRRVSAARVLDEERALAEALLGRLPLAGAEREDGFTMRIPDGDRAADLVVALAELGDGVVVEWAEDAGKIRVVGTAQRKDLRLRISKKRDWFGVEGEVSVDGARVPLARLLDAAREGHRFVRVGPGEFMAIARELRERLLAADDALQSTARGLEAHAPAIERVSGLVEQDAQIDAAREWLELRARMKRAETLQTKLPKGLAAELRPYQLEGFQWMARLATWGTGGCLADDMGLGKTVQALALLLHRVKDGPALVVAPTSVCAGWVDEAARFAPSLKVRLYRGPARAKLLRGLGDGVVLVTSYDLLARDIDALRETRFATLVLDEAQSVKNAASQRAAAARAVDAEVRFALSGTPVENHLGELWSLFRIVSPGLLGSWERFRGRFAAPIERDRDTQRKAALASLIRPFLLRRTKAKVAPELPPRTEIARMVTLSRAERERYEAERKRAMETMISSETPDHRFAMLAAITRLRRLACHPRLVDEGSPLASSKLVAFLELVEELREGGHRALVFSQFTSHLTLVREALDRLGVSYATLDGSTPAEERARLCAAFQDEQLELFLISLKAGGTGLNLTAADTVVHLDPWWNPAAEDQASDRAHRIGQTKPVTVVRLIVKGTIEEAVVALHAEKRELADSLLGGAEVAGRLSAPELAALVQAGEAASDDDEPADGPPPPARARSRKAPRAGE